MRNRTLGAQTKFHCSKIDKYINKYVLLKNIFLVDFFQSKDIRSHLGSNAKLMLQHHRVSQHVQYLC